MKKCNSSSVIIGVLLLSLYLFSQIKVSSISRLLAAISSYPGIYGLYGGSDTDSKWASPIRCDRSHENYDICSINGPTVLDSKASTFYAVGPKSPKPMLEKIRPYPQKNSTQTMARINEITLTSGPPSPPCTVQHSAPALVFSVGGYTWNFFHAFIDGFIPLFITVNSISPDDQDLVLVITNSQDWWVRKYVDLFRSFSKHPIITLENDTSVHCFPSATVGLISHGFMTIDPKKLPNSKTTLHFHELLEKAYCRGRRPSVPAASNLRPRLVLLSRGGGVGRVIMNQAEVKRAAEEEGFDVVEFEPKHDTPLHEACALMRSSHAVVGVHGAAFTYALFLRPRSVLVQVVGLGLDKVAELCFGRFAKDMEFEYMEYKIGVEESTLIDRYGRDDAVVKNPNALQKEWFDAIMEVYLRQQNVRLDVARFRGYLKRAYDKARQQMLKGA